ncbi:hypothetical protein V5O48_000272 [Marasmius crinis-equi]|uniref:DUF6593 domain-containing protein n=1 Tax=Marasmius crinis-equi TaxID=585013 RepID=A0ABR3G2A0_9AGAR
MDLIFSHDDARNTTLSSSSGQPLYEISTPGSREQTTITKLHPGEKPTEIGCVELRSGDASVCQVSGRDVLPRTGEFGRKNLAWSFTSSNGEKYTWTRKWDSNLLFDLTDTSKTSVVVYERSHSGFFSGKPRPAKLTLLPEGVALGILDEIVVTFVYIGQKAQQFRRAALIASGAATGASGFGW